MSEWLEHGRALRAAFRQQWRQMFVPSGLAGPIIGAVGPAAVLGFIVGGSDQPVALSYVFVGVALSILWNNGIFRTGWSLAEEQTAGTLELMLTTRTPLAVVMLGKALAIVAFAVPAALVAFSLVLLIAGDAPAIADGALFFAAGVVALLAVIASAFFFAPFSFLAGVRGGYFNAIMPFGAVVSGFLYPVDVLPASLEAVARVLPTAWAMQAVVDSLNGEASGAVLALCVAVALSALVLAVTFALFLRVERKIRMDGSLAGV